MAVAHSYCYKLLSAQTETKEHTEIWWTAIWLTRRLVYIDGVSITAYYLAFMQFVYLLAKCLKNLHR